MGNYDSGTPVPAIPVSWSETPIVINITWAKKSHFVELREALEAMDGHYHVFNGNNSGAELPDVTVSWGEASNDIIVNETFVKASHFQEIIDYLKDFEEHYHYVSAYNHGIGSQGNSTTFSPSFTFEDDPIIVDVTWIKATAWEEVRNHLETCSSHIHTVCCECECQCTCTCQCECECTCTCTCDPEI